MTTRRRPYTVVALVTVVCTLAACAAPDPDPVQAAPASWSEIADQARGQTVSLWMYGGDEQGNTYVDDVLAPAAQQAGVTLRRVPIADTGDALNRILAERQAGVTDGDVDLVWVNGDNFGTGKQAGAWLCGWTESLPNMALTDPDDPLLTNDFGTPVDGCEITLAQGAVHLGLQRRESSGPADRLSRRAGLGAGQPWTVHLPGAAGLHRVGVRPRGAHRVSGGPQNVPLQFSQQDYDRLAPPLFERLNALKPDLWRAGATYPQTSSELNELYADGQVDMTMTYGPATLTELVADGTYPPQTRVLTLTDGTVGNASFLAIPSTSGSSAGARVVANVALSPQQQLEKAKPEVWGQFTVLDLGRLSATDRAAFDALPASPVVPPYDVLARDAHAELAAEWVAPLDEGWRRNVLAAD